jgi:hypothetical protein
VLEIASEGLFCATGEGGANPSLRHSRASLSGAQGATRGSMPGASLPTASGAEPAQLVDRDLG